MIICVFISKFHEFVQDFINKALYTLGMQWLKLVSEDGGVQRLKAGNRLPAATPGVAPVPPYPATHSARIGGHPEPGSRRPLKDRRQNERRQGGDRRKKQIPVVLDTRSKHDRRALENRREGKKCRKNKPPARSRINVYA